VVTVQGLRSGSDWTRKLYTTRIPRISVFVSIQLLYLGLLCLPRAQRLYREVEHICSDLLSAMALVLSRLRCHTRSYQNTMNVPRRPYLKQRNSSHFTIIRNKYEKQLSASRKLTNIHNPARFLTANIMFKRRKTHGGEYDVQSCLVGF
jgi:hypothetical protein